MDLSILTKLVALIKAVALPTGKYIFYVDVHRICKVETVRLYLEASHDSWI